MKLRRKYELHIRDTLYRFGRWSHLAHLSNSAGSSPLNRLLGELADGKSSKYLQRKLNELSADPEIRARAELLLNRYRESCYLDDDYAMRIDLVLTFILRNFFPEYRELMLVIFNHFYMQSDDVNGSVVGLARSLVDAGICDLNDEKKQTMQAQSASRLFLGIKARPELRPKSYEDIVMSYSRRISRFREQLEADIYYALKFFENQKQHFDREQTEMSLFVFSRAYFERKEFDSTQLIIKSRYYPPAGAFLGNSKEV